MSSGLLHHLYFLHPGKQSASAVWHVHGSSSRIKGSLLRGFTAFETLSHAQVSKAGQAELTPSSLGDTQRAVPPLAPAPAEHDAESSVQTQP